MLGAGSVRGADAAVGILRAAALAVEVPEACALRSGESDELALGGGFAVRVADSEVLVFGAATDLGAVLAAFGDGSGAADCDVDAMMTAAASGSRGMQMLSLEVWLRPDASSADPSWSASVNARQIRILRVLLSLSVWRVECAHHELQTVNRIRCRRSKGGQPRPLSCERRVEGARLCMA